MGLHPRGRGHGRGGRGSFYYKGQWGNGTTSQEPIFTYGPEGTFCPPSTSFCGPQGFGQPSIFHINPARPACGKFLWKRANRRHTTKSNGPQPLVQFQEKGFRNHYCESCDKSFRTEDDLLVHKAGHETCNHDGCEFTAHPKILAKHIKMQHESGLYRRIGNLYTEEDIAKWIEERKKRYPTRKIIEDKKLLEEEKLKRGERIKDDDFKFNKSFNNRNKKGRKKNFEKQTHKIPKNRRTRRKKETSLSQKHLGEEQVEDFRKGIPAFLGIGNTSEPDFPEESELNISDDEWEAECKTPNVTKTLVNNSLGLLAEFYNSDEDNVIQAPQDEVVMEGISADEGSGPEEVNTVCSKNLFCEEKLDEKKGLKKRKFCEKELNKRKRENVFNQCKVNEKSLSLLEKLLKKEIRHERNVILQCIHYIVSHNFFKT